MKSFQEELGSQHAYGPGSQQALRRRNIGILLKYLQENGPATQKKLADGTSFSQATVSNLVKILKEENLVRTTLTTSSGRRAILVEVVMKQEQS